EKKHYKFKDRASLNQEDAANIFNNTKVVEARILGYKQSGGASGVMLNQPLNDNKFSDYIRGKVSVGSVLNFADSIKVNVLELNDDGSSVVNFIKAGVILDPARLFSALAKIGHLPLPPYIQRAATTDVASWYPSIFAQNRGAVSAPTA
ncbi:S-adenosylmethionine:tRNA ribosyltransferase-isomerase, partial [Campylobacter concisus]|uniref:S-adenosylmethionine:tRNA ribosyltransferase-isomerase n=1 Tax=Campylobacter concisus TaxID=199 RepID=UPI0015E18708